MILHLFVDIYNMLLEGLVVNYGAELMCALAASVLTADTEGRKLQ